MKNKLYQVQGVNADYSNIVSAPNFEQAKKLGANTSWTDGIDYDDLIAIPIIGGDTWYQEEPEIHFYIKGKEVVYTHLATGIVDWDNFIEELEKQNLLRIDTGVTFNENVLVFEETNYFGIPIKEYEKIINDPNLKHDISHFDEFCEHIGVDVDKITFKQAEQLLNGELTLQQLKDN